MVSNVDETELALLEALACAAGAGDYSAHDDADDSAKFAAAACNAVPALVAELRRLREDRAAMLIDMDAIKTKAEPCDDCWTIYMLMREMGIEEKNWFHRDVCARLKAMQNDEEENAALRGKVDRLKRDYECSEKSLQRHEHMVAELMEKVEAWEWFGECFDNCKQRGKLPLEVHKTPSAYSEAWASLWAAREAVHADRE